MLQHFKSLLAQNQFLAGGFILGMIAAALSSLRKAPAFLFRKAKAFFLTSIEVDSKHEVYTWLATWLSKRPKEFKTSVPIVTWANRSGRAYPEVGFLPAEGLFCFMFNRTLMWFHLSKKENIIGDFAIGETRKITVMKLGKSKVSLNALLQEAHLAYRPDDFSKIRIFHFYSNYWQCFTNHPTRRKETLVFENGVVDTLLADAELFTSRKDWYEALGIPYRRGYLFFGEPGNGKSSLGILLASHLRRDICILSLSSIEDDQELYKAMFLLPANCVVVLEDIDAAFSGRDKENGLTFSGLLNSLDGIGAGEGRILVMTTNHKERLDPALIRTGRADYHQYIGNASPAQMALMFKRFFPDSTDCEAEHFAKSLPVEGTSMSQVQEILIQRHAEKRALEDRHV
jgi:chaperone BCS1